MDTRSQAKSCGTGRDLGTQFSALIVCLALDYDRGPLKGPAIVPPLEELAFKPSCALIMHNPGGERTYW